MNGEIEGFRIRPELAKVAMWRDKDDLSLFYKAIRMVNYLNRLTFAKEDNLRLVSDMTPLELSENPSKRTIPEVIVPVQVEPEIQQVEVPVPIPHSAEFECMVETFRDHSTNIIARGDNRMYN